MHVYIRVCGCLRVSGRWVLRYIAAQSLFLRCSELQHLHKTIIIFQKLFIIHVSDVVMIRKTVPHKRKVVWIILKLMQPAITGAIHLTLDRDTALLAPCICFSIFIHCSDIEALETPKRLSAVLISIILFLLLARCIFVS